ncbi:hypothetical protein AOA80_03685 [Methanomassiliicoccales archaeon RumEn M1]|nr:hypothetical protein AOA80_03685 [Methanomassiliicoccales archaeon RumEn M1]
MMPLRKLHSHGCPYHCCELDLFESMPHEDAGTQFDVVSWYCPECRQVFTFLNPADEAAGYWPDGDDGLGGE